MKCAEANYSPGIRGVMCLVVPNFVACVFQFICTLAAVPLWGFLWSKILSVS